MDLAGLGSVNTSQKPRIEVGRISDFRINSIDEYCNYLIYLSKTYSNWEEYCKNEYLWLNNIDKHHTTRLENNMLTYTKFCIHGSTSPLSIPHEHSVLESGIRPLLKYVKYGGTEVVYDAVFSFGKNKFLSCNTEFELIDRRVLKIEKKVRKTKAGSDVPEYYIGDRKYNGVEYKKFMKDLVEYYNNWE